MKHVRRFGGFVVAICPIVLHTLAVDSAAATQTSGMVANGTTLTVTTANAVATFAGLDLVGFVNALTNETYLKKPSNGHFATVNALSATPPAQQLSNWTIGAEPGTGLPLATITSNDFLRLQTLTVKIDPATQEIVLRASASVASPGVRGAWWSIAGLDQQPGTRAEPGLRLGGVERRDADRTRGSVAIQRADRAGRRCVALGFRRRRFLLFDRAVDRSRRQSRARRQRSPSSRNPV
jgi:hypothetical protein